MSASQTIPVGSLSAALASGAVVGAGSVTAFRRLMERVWPEQTAPLAVLAVGMGLRREQAADVLQEVYLTAIAHSPPIDREADLARWLFRVTANRCRLEHRRRGRWRRLWQSLSGAWQGDVLATAVPIGELRREVDRALARLNDSDRLLVVLRYFADLNSREIAEIVEQPESTVRSRLRAARTQLAGDLAEWNDHE